MLELRLLVVDWGDSGVYTCKTNSGSRAEMFQLSVRDTVASITGSRVRELEEGEELSLHCLVRLAPGPNTHFRQEQRPWLVIL